MTDIERLNELPPDSFQSFDLAHAILMSASATMPDKLAALSRIDKAMGGIDQPINEQAVIDYIATHQEG